MNPSSFNRHRIAALVVFMIGGILAWYGMILMTNRVGTKPAPDRDQWIGLGIVALVEIALWVQSCLTIKPYNSDGDVAG